MKWRPKRKGEVLLACLLACELDSMGEGCGNTYMCVCARVCVCMGVGRGGGGGLFVELARIFRSGLIFGKMLFHRGGMLYLVEISKKLAFRICMGYGGGGVGGHNFSEIRAEVGRFQDFGLSVQNTQVAN